MVFVRFEEGFDYLVSKIYNILLIGRVYFVENFFVFGDLVIYFIGRLV